MSTVNVNLDKLMHAKVERLLPIVAGYAERAILRIWAWGHHARGWRERRRIMRGHCPKCDYYLRGSIWNCPECGAEIPREALLNFLIIEGKPLRRTFANQPRWRKAADQG